MPIFWDGFGFTETHSGIARHAGELAKALSAEGVEPRFLCASFQESLGHVERVSWGVPLRRVKALWPTLCYEELVYKRSQPFIFHGLSNINLPILKKRKGHTFFLTLHDVIPLLAPAEVSSFLALQFRWLLPRILPCADRILCVSQWTQGTLEAAFPGTRGKTVVIPNGFPSWRGVSCAESAGPIRVLMVSRFEAYKQFDLIKKLLEGKPAELEFSLVTDAKGLAYFAPLQGEGVRLYTAISQPALETLYRETDVLVHTSRYEGFCLPASEALSFGKPVVFFQGSGVDETVPLSLGCGLKAHDSLASWYEALLFWGGGGRSTAFQDACRSHVETRTTWQQAAHALAEEYRVFGG